MTGALRYLIYTSGIQGNSKTREWGIKYASENLPGKIALWEDFLSRFQKPKARVQVKRFSASQVSLYWVLQKGKDDLERANIFGVLLWQDDITPEIFGKIRVAEGHVNVTEEKIIPLLSDLEAHLKSAPQLPQIKLSWDSGPLWEILAGLQFTPVDSQADLAFVSASSSGQEKVPARGLATKRTILSAATFFALLIIFTATSKIWWSHRSQATIPPVSSVDKPSTPSPEMSQKQNVAPQSSRIQGPMPDDKKVSQDTTAATHKLDNKAKYGSFLPTDTRNSSATTDSMSHKTLEELQKSALQCEKKEKEKQGK